jgi:hypothetical protein
MDATRSRGLRVGVVACIGLLACTSGRTTNESPDSGGSSSGASSGSGANSSSGAGPGSGASSGSSGATPDGGRGQLVDSGGEGDGAGSVDAAGEESDACQPSITVTVMDPTGRYPIPNVYVFVQDGPLPPVDSGIGACPSIPGAGAGHTGFDGSATIDSPQSGTVTVEALVGKWRTTQSVSVPACGGSAVTLKLPGDSAHGSVPAIAVSTGEGDTLECTLHRMGIDGAITVFQGHGGATATGAMPSTTLWATADALSAFDAVLLSCEGAETTGTIPANLAAYANAGGHVFAEHFQYAWFNAPPFSAQGTATWSAGANLFSGTVSVAPSRTLDGVGVWQALAAYGVPLTNYELPMTSMEPAHNATLGAAASLTLSTDGTSSAPDAPLLFSWSEGTHGGSIVYADFHIGSASSDYGTTPGATAVPSSASFPSGCQTASALTPSELIFLYTLFDDLSCFNGSIMH